MAKVRVYQSIEDTNYVMLFKNDVNDVTTADKSLIEKFGEPEVNCGGDFDDGNGLTYTLPDVYVKIISGLPYRQVFDPTVAPWSTNTANKLTLYRTTMLTRFTSAFTTLRANSDTFTNEYVQNI